METVKVVERCTWEETEPGEKGCVMFGRLRGSSNSEMVRTILLVDLGRR